MLAARAGLRVLLRWDLICPPGLYAGIKFFLIDFIFKRCPRLRAKYDTPYIIWKSLPTDPQLKERSSTAASRRVGRVPAGEACLLGEQGGGVVARPPSRPQSCRCSCDVRAPDALWGGAGRTPGAPLLTATGSELTNSRKGRCL